jgi:hypothetical protein
VLDRGLNILIECLKFLKQGYKKHLFHYLPCQKVFPSFMDSPSYKIYLNVDYRQYKGHVREKRVR